MLFNGQHFGLWPEGLQFKPQLGGVVSFRCFYLLFFSFSYSGVCYCHIKKSSTGDGKLATTPPPHLTFRIACIDLTHCAFVFDSFKITSPLSLNTIPDLIVALKAFHQILHENVPFSKWIATQAARLELYSSFRTNKFGPLVFIYSVLWS